MSNSLKIALYFVGTLALGALLAPPLFWAGHALGGAFPPLGVLQAFDFQRYFDRAMFLAALLVLWPAARALRIGGWRDLGLEPDSRAWPHAALGFLAAGGLLWGLGVLFWTLGVYAPRSSLHAKDFGIFLVSAVPSRWRKRRSFAGCCWVWRGARPGPPRR